MSDNDKQQTQETKQFKYEIHIGITDIGEIAIKDNLNDMVIAFGMCDMAKDMIKTKIIQSQQSKIIPPKHGMLDFRRRR